jgi:hypothetical protein
MVGRVEADGAGDEVLRRRAREVLRVRLLLGDRDVAGRADELSNSSLVTSVLSIQKPFT